MASVSNCILYSLLFCEVVTITRPLKMEEINVDVRNEIQNARSQNGNLNRIEIQGSAIKMNADGIEENTIIIDRNNYNTARKSPAETMWRTSS